MKQTRLDALSDGIFAIVMTILVFEIRIPYFSGSLPDKEIFDLLISILPLLINYILSFSLLFTYWRSNHFIASVLAKNIDVHFSNLNGLFLFLVALIPFFSNFLGNYPNSKVTVIAFAVINNIDKPAHKRAFCIGFTTIIHGYIRSWQMVDG